jgi:hypothetical protein
MSFSSRRFNESFSKDDEVGLFYTRDKYGGLRVPAGYDFLKENPKRYLSDSEPKGIF